MNKRLFLRSLFATCLLQLTLLSISQGKDLRALSAQGTELAGPAYQSWKTNQLAPRGSASLTSSGALAQTGIQYIIHAAPGSMSSYDQFSEPSLDSVRLSIGNAIRLADQNGIRKIAIPLIGGGIFISRMKTSKAELAAAIIDAAMKQPSKIEITFVAYDDTDTQNMQAALRQSQASKPAKTKNKNLIMSWLEKIMNHFLSKNEQYADFFDRANVVQGSITDFRVHGAEAIVNAANMELQFGGGLSGAIAKASENAQHIDDINRQLIEDYYR